MGPGSVAQLDDPVVQVNGGHVTNNGKQGEDQDVVGAPALDVPRGLDTGKWDHQTTLNGGQDHDDEQRGNIEDRNSDCEPEWRDGGGECGGLDFFHIYE